MKLLSSAKRTRLAPVGLLTVIYLLLAGCGAEKQPEAEIALTNQPRIFVVNYPLAYFTRQLTGDAAEVVFPVPQQTDPAYWEPSGEEIARWQEADMVVLNGADFAKWTLRATLPWSRTVVTTDSFPDAVITIPDAVVHSHGPEGEHAHEGIVSQTWLDLKLAIQQADFIRQQLLNLIPNASIEIEANFAKLKSELGALDAEYGELFRSTPAQWYACRPLYHYLARRYGIDIETLHWDEDAEPTTEQWESLATISKDQPAIVLWSQPPTEATHEQLRQAGIEAVYFETAGHQPQEGDFLTIMRANASRVRTAMLTD